MSSRAKFPADYYIEALRGYERPTPSDMRKVLAHRAAWLERKVEQHTLARRPSADPVLRELAVIARVAELVPPAPTVVHCVICEASVVWIDGRCLAALTRTPHTHEEPTP